MNCNYIPPENLRYIWQWVREGLEKIQSKGATRWIVEDVYCDCHEGRSFLYVASKETPIGFMVVQPVGDILHVWAAWLNSINPDDLRDGLIHVKRLAREHGCNSITFTSVRRGWEKKARQLGFTPSTWEIKC